LALLLIGLAWGAVHEHEAKPEVVVVPAGEVGAPKVVHETLEETGERKPDIVIVANTEAEAKKAVDKTIAEVAKDRRRRQWGGYGGGQTVIIEEIILGKKK